MATEVKNFTVDGDDVDVVGELTVQDVVGPGWLLFRLVAWVSEVEVGWEGHGVE